MYTTLCWLVWHFFLGLKILLLTMSCGLTSHTHLQFTCTADATHLISTSCLFLCIKTTDCIGVYTTYLSSGYCHLLSNVSSHGNEDSLVCWSETVFNHLLARGKFSTICTNSIIDTTVQSFVCSLCPFQHM